MESAIHGPEGRSRPRWRPWPHRSAPPVRTRNRKHSLAAIEACDASTTSSAELTSGVRQGSEVCLQLGHGGQRAVDGFARRVGLHEAVRHSPSEDRSHPLTHPTGCLRPGRPYRGEDLQYTPGGLYGPEVYCPESAWRDAQESVSSLRCAWRCATGYVRLMDDMGGFLERRHWRPLLLGQKIATFRNRGPVVQRLLASSGEAYGRKSAQVRYRAGVR